MTTTDLPFVLEDPKVHATVEGRHIYVYFDGFDFSWVNKIKQIPGAKFEGKEKGGPSWRLPLEVDVCNRMREIFEDALTYTPELAKWYRITKRQVMNLQSLANSADAQLDRLPYVLPELYEFISSRPYQKADIKFMADSPSPGNVNHPGLGKTVEVIGAVFEAGLDEGPQLVMAPVSSLETVWQFELERWQPHPVIVAKGGRNERLYWLETAQTLAAMGEPFWLVCNPAMVQYRRKRKTDGSLEEVLSYPEFMEIEWVHKIVDEFHKCGLGNTSTLTAKALNKVPAQKSIAVSGTPMQGKPIKLYGMLHYLDPETFSSKWRFADQWLEVTDNGYGKSIHGVRRDRQQAFFDMLGKYMVRRTKAEVAPQLPPKQFVDLWVDLEGEQLKQYKEFERLAAIKIEDEELSATSILAEYTRLKQFALAVQDISTRHIRRMKKTEDVDQDYVTLIPREPFTSAKLEQVERILNELGIDPENKEDGLEGEEQVVIFSQFTTVVKALTKYLDFKGYPVDQFHGETTGDKRAELQRNFQDPSHPLRVLVMNIQTGGVSITLDQASTCIFLDETWVPDDQEQAADRIHRASKIHQVTVYTIRSRNTIEEYIAQTNVNKQSVNDLILDLRRKMKPT